MTLGLKRLGKDSLVYGAGGVLSGLVPFLLLPVFTRLFTPEEFGILELLIVLAGLLVSFVNTGQDSALSYFFFQEKEQGKESQARLVSAMLQWIVPWGALLVVLGVLASTAIYDALFDGDLRWHHFAAAFGGGVLGLFSRQGATLFRLLFRPWGYVAATLTASVLSSGLAIVLVLVLDWGILGYFVGLAIGKGVAAVGTWIALRDYLDLSSFHRDWWPRLLRFGAPLLPEGIATLVLMTADRWFLSQLVDLSAVGIYAVAAKVVLVAAMGVQAFRLAWWPLSMEALREERGPRLFAAVARLYLAIAALGMILLTAIAPGLVKLLSAPEYHAAYPIVGVLGWYVVFEGFFLIGGGGLWKAEKTGWVTAGMIGAACLNLLLNLWWIPLLGAIGAAAATAVSFLAWNVLTLALSQRLWRVDYPLVTMALVTGVGVASTLGINWMYTTDRSLLEVVGLAVGSSVLVCVLALRRGFLDQLRAELGSRGDDGE